MSLNIGLDENQRINIAKNLASVLSDTYFLTLKTKKYHWNVTGPNFHSLHKMFESQYKELDEINDNIAERIRVMGVKAPGSHAEFSELASIEEDTTAKKSPDKMVETLLHDHERMVRNIKEVTKTVGNAYDEGTLGLLGDQMSFHEKTAWMLKSTIS